MTEFVQTDDGGAKVVSHVPHAPTSKTRSAVRTMVACGLTAREIARVFSCEPREITSAYKDELEHGAAIVNAKVGAALLRNALQGDTVAQKFWLQTRAKWVPSTAVEHSGEIAISDRRNLIHEITQLAISHAADTQPSSSSGTLQ